MSSPSSPLHSALPPCELPPNQSGEIAGEPSDLANAKVIPSDFLLMRVVGQGAFGKVYQISYCAVRSSLIVNLCSY